MERARSVLSALALPRLLARGMGIFGVLALLASVFAPWFSVPGVPGEPVWNSVFRALVAAACIVGAFTFLRLRRRSQTLQILFALIGALLFFPYFITIWSPKFAGEASWLHAQHESLTGSSGDLYLSQENKADSWRQRVDIVNRPIASEIVDFPDWNRFDIGRLIDVADWFGASPWFAIFVRKGWVLALCGSAACLLALLCEGPEWTAPTREIFQRSLFVFTAAFAIAFTPPLAAVTFLGAAREAAQNGDTEAASRRLEHAADCLPALREDGAFIAERGLLDDALKIASPEAALFRARLLELRGFDEQAQARYLAGLDATGSRAVHREYLKSLLSLAADDLNSGEVSAATALYGAVLAHDPNNLKANYALQLTAVRSVDLAQLQTLQAQMETLYRAFNTPTKQAVLALSHENGAFAETLDGDSLAAWQALARARKP